MKDMRMEISMEGPQADSHFAKRCQEELASESNTHAFLPAASSEQRHMCPDHQCVRKRHRRILQPLAKPLLLWRRAFQELSGRSVSGLCGLETRLWNLLNRGIPYIGCVGLSLNPPGKS